LIDIFHKYPAMSENKQTLRRNFVKLLIVGAGIVLGAGNFIRAVVDWTESPVAGGYSDPTRLLHFPEIRTRKNSSSGSDIRGLGHPI
jgi:hypothetical protein